MEVMLIIVDICALFAVVRWSAKAESQRPKNDKTDPARRLPTPPRR